MIVFQIRLHREAYDIFNLENNDISNSFQSDVITSSYIEIPELNGGVSKSPPNLSHLR